MQDYSAKGGKKNSKSILCEDKMLIQTAKSVSIVENGLKVIVFQRHRMLTSNGKLKVKNGDSYLAPHCPHCKARLAIPFQLDTRNVWKATVNYPNLPICKCGKTIGYNSIAWSKVFVCAIEC